MAIFKAFTKHELYVYMNGGLIYKRWLNTGQSMVFDSMAYSKFTLTSIRDLAFEHPGTTLIEIKAILTLTPYAKGGRDTGIRRGHVFNHVFEKDKDDHARETFTGDILFEGGQLIQPGETREVAIRFLMNPHLDHYLLKGRKWWLYEHGKLVGEARMV